METELELYPRQCDCCGKGMNKGYHDSGAVYCSDRCLVWGNSEETIDPNTGKGMYTMQDWEKDCEENEDECYYTEWEELDEDVNFTANGGLVYTCASCSKLVDEEQVHEESFCPFCLQEVQ